MKIDKELCERFMATLPKQEIAFDGEQIVATGPHWLPGMIDEALDSKDRSCEVLASFVKKHIPLFKTYINLVCDQQIDDELKSEKIRDSFLQEIVVMFCFFIMKFAYKSKENN